MPRRLGQHFLRDANVLRRVADALAITSGEKDIVIEIGPGHGELTDELRARKPARIVLIEKDPQLAEALREKYADDIRRGTLALHVGDVRRVLAEVVEQEVPRGTAYKLVGNIPYYLTGFLLRLLSELPRPPERVIVMMQKEVAERLVAGPPHMTKLSASVQFWADPKIVVATVPARAFHPAPEVDSTVVALTPKTPAMDSSAYYAFVHRLFAQPRKTIANNLIAKDAGAGKREKIHAALAELGIAPDARPQTLDLPVLLQLAKRLGA